MNLPAILNAFVSFSVAVFGIQHFCILYRRKPGFLSQRLKPYPAPRIVRRDHATQHRTRRWHDRWFGAQFGEAYKYSVAE